MRVYNPVEINPFDWPDVNAYHAARVLLLLLSHFGFFLPLRQRQLLFSPFFSPSYLPSLSFSPVARTLAFFLSFLPSSLPRRRVMGLKVCIPITEKRIVVRSRVIARPGLVTRLAATRALVYHRSFCYGDVPLFSPRFRDSLTHRLVSSHPPRSLSKASAVSVCCRGTAVADFIRIE